VIQSLRNRVRGILNVRSPRAMPSRGPKPAIGRQIAFGDVRITVQAGFSDELWLWLLEHGWRELRYRPDQRRYRDVPASCVTELIDASEEERQAALEAAKDRASKRPVLGQPDVPSYIARH
jgi:hypothetical protein